MKTTNLDTKMNKSYIQTGLAIAVAVILWGIVTGVIIAAFMI